MRVIALAAALAAPACMTGVDADPGRDAAMIVTGAQFYRGQPPGDEGGPRVTTLSSADKRIHPAQFEKRVGGTAEGDSREVAYFLDGDLGYWMVPVGLNDPTMPSDLDFDGRLSFAPTLDAGDRTLHVQATGADGRFGPSDDLVFTVQPLTVATSTLDVQLTWDTDADVDLHVTEPDGITIWARNINSYQSPPPGQPPGDPTTGGVLDFDSNASCVIDGRREENVYWTVAPPPGHYVVRVDTWALCGQTAARWHVVAELDGQTLAQAHGESIDSDTTFTKTETAGVLAFTFDVP